MSNSLKGPLWYPLKRLSCVFTKYIICEVCVKSTRSTDKTNTASFLLFPASTANQRSTLSIIPGLYMEDYNLTSYNDWVCLWIVTHIYKLLTDNASCCWKPQGPIIPETSFHVFIVLPQNTFLLANVISPEPPAPWGWLGEGSPYHAAYNTTICVLRSRPLLHLLQGKTDIN